MFIELDNLEFERIEDDEPSLRAWLSVLAILTPLITIGAFLWWVI
jgi:hypothetical protein